MFSKMMKQAQAMQQKLAQVQEEIRLLQIEATAGGGAVTVSLSGEGKVLGVRLSPQAMDDRETLEDLILVACENGWKELEEKKAEKMKSVEVPSGLKGLL